MTQHISAATPATNASAVSAVNNLRFDFERDPHLVGETRKTHNLDRDEQRMYAFRDAFLAGRASRTFDETSAILRDVIAFQRDDGSFALVSDYAMPSDCRVYFIYRPSYACCQVLMSALVDGVEVEGLREALASGLAFSCTRGLVGDGYEGVQHQMEDLADFVRAGLLEFLDRFPTLCPQFTKLVNDIADGYVARLAAGKTQGGWLQDYTLRLMDAAAMLGRPTRVPVFVYGTLMAGMPNHPLVAESAYAGTAELRGYRVYELGAYPGIKRDPSGAGVVLGEVYLCDAATLRRLDVLEGVGVLYDRATEQVTVGVGEAAASIAAQVYVYRGDVEPGSEIPAALQPYPRARALQRSHVWYVCYGSNLLRERFMTYLEGGDCRFNGRHYAGCSDPSAPLLDTAVELPGSVYFGNTSTSWGGCGAAFLDVAGEKGAGEKGAARLGGDWAGSDGEQAGGIQPGHTIGRAYLVTREQYRELWAAEGRSASWYCDEVDLGRMAGIPMVTFTNLRRRPANAPSEAYLDVMRAGLAETLCGRLSDEQVEKYLAEAIAR